jgi:hypothetical protein
MRDGANKLQGRFAGRRLAEASRNRLRTAMGGQSI